MQFVLILIPVLLLVLLLKFLAEVADEVRRHSLEKAVSCLSEEDVGLADLVDMRNLVLEVVEVLH